MALFVKLLHLVLAFPDVLGGRLDLVLLEGVFLCAIPEGHREKRERQLHRLPDRSDPDLRVVFLDEALLIRQLLAEQDEELLLLLRKDGLAVVVLLDHRKQLIDEQDLVALG